MLELTDMVGDPAFLYKVSHRISNQVATGRISGIQLDIIFSTGLYPSSIKTGYPAKLISGRSLLEFEMGIKLSRVPGEIKPSKLKYKRIPERETDREKYNPFSKYLE